MHRTLIVAAAVILVMGCGSTRGETLDGSPPLDTNDDVTGLLSDQQTPDQQTPDQQTPDQQAPDLAGPDHQLPDTHAPKDHGTCSAPSYSSDCSQVPSFQCGFGVTCVNGTTLKADWHEHVFCPGYDVEQFLPSYSCTYTCPKGCKSGYTGWPSSGAQLVKDACIP